MTSASESLISDIKAICSVPTLSYCDYIAHVTRRALVADADKGGFVRAADRVRWDLHPTDGYMLTTKKTIEVVDRNGTRYRVTVEEVES